MLMVVVIVLVENGRSGHITYPYKMALTQASRGRLNAATLDYG